MKPFLLTHEQRPIINLKKAILMNHIVLLTHYDAAVKRNVFTNILVYAAHTFLIQKRVCCIFTNIYDR